jgi:predicted enzyme related to lactoylglutathione lyase
MNTQRNPVGWFELYVADMERARAFYEKTLQVTLERLEMPGLEMWMFPMLDDRPGAPGALVRMEGMTPGAGGTVIYFSCVDCAEDAARAAKNGGTVIKEKFPIGDYGFVAFVRDTEGNMIGLHSIT